MDTTKTIDFVLERWRKRITGLTFFATLFGFVCALVWLTPFWSSFDVNVLQYLTASDRIKHTLPWILLAALASGLVWLHPSATREAQGPRKKIELKWVILAVVLNLGLAGIAFSQEIRPLIYVLLWVPLAVIAGEWLFRRVRESSDFTFLADKTLRLLTLGAPACLIALFAISLGRAESVTRGTEYRVVTLLSAKTKDWLPASGLDETRPRFIGQAGEYLFLYEPTSKSTIVIKLDAGDSYQTRLVQSRK